MTQPGIRALAGIRHLAAALRAQRAGRLIPVSSQSSFSIPSELALII
jgi:hypothetical protein